MTTGTSTSPPSQTWIDEWWASRTVESRTARLEAESTDPGFPAWYDTATGGKTYAPWSAVMAARERRYPSLLNLDKLHRRVLELLGVKL